MPDENTTDADKAAADTEAIEGEAAAKAESEELAAGGKKALDAERAARKKAEKAAKDAQAELERINLENASEQEKSLAAAKAEGKSEATEAANKRIIRSEVKAAAARKLNDPNDAVQMLDLAQFEVDADGNVDEAAISTAIDELVTTKPYLAADAKPASAGSADGGARSDGPALSVKQQIAEAETAGDWERSSQLKARQLYEAAQT